MNQCTECRKGIEKGYICDECFQEKLKQKIRGDE